MLKNGSATRKSAPARSCSQERGLSILMFLGTLGILILFAAFLINSLLYYSLKENLQGTSETVARYAATFLPNPQAACEQAKSIYSAASLDLTDSTPSSMFTSAVLKLYFDASNGDRIEVPNVGNLPKCAGITGNFAELPITRMYVRIESTFTFQFFKLDQLANLSFANIAAAAESSAQLTPTDVMIVLENSNSVVSKASAIPTPAGFQSIFGTDYIGTTSVTRAQLYTRQCFGDSFKDMKTAALELYDLLSSSGTFRVGFITTHPAKAEASLPWVKLSNHPLARNTLTSPSNETNINYTNNDASANYGIPLQKPVATPVPNGNHLQEFKSANLEVGLDYPEQRCAAIMADFPIPAHPFATYMSTTLPTDLSADMCDASCTDPNKAIKLKAATLLRPRELIWLTNAGVNIQNESLDPEADYSHMQLALNRATDILLSAPQRGDGIEVKRKIILVLTDGVDQTFNTVVDTDYNDYDSFKDNRSTRDPNFVTNGAAPTLQFTYNNAAQFHEDYCAATNSAGAPNQIHTLTNVPGTGAITASSQVRLGVLLYGLRSTFGATDPLNWLDSIANHDPAGARFTTFRTDCNTKWGPISSRFWAEVSSSMNAPLQTGSAYYTYLVPRIARTLFSVDE